jgi:hypothetical protein
VVSNRKVTIQERVNECQCVWFVCQQTIEKCGCLSSDLSYDTEQLKRTNYTMCRNQTWLEYNETNPTSPYNQLNEVAAFNRVLCMYNTNLSYNDCIERCPPSCQTLHYFTTNSHSNPWPHISRHLAFYDQYIKGTNYSDNFAEYAEINNNLKQKVISKVSLSDLLQIDTNDSEGSRHSNK